ncbi:hypothetical protein Ciccas_004298 [Cichlidogyrus casuarinus]|uniref:Glutathione peroxidase n=1 Tax=Cichlidogyrus casuarinus TaxID=1844966 RepID=A0ABD2QC06_9PLAT
MTLLSSALVALIVLTAGFQAKPQNIYGFNVLDIDENQNYAQLNDLFARYHDQGLEVLAFPCNQFLGQEPGTDAEIKAKIMKRWNPKFDLFARIDVNGKNEAPLYTYLKDAQSTWFGKDIGWNYVKFVIDRNGVPVNRYTSTTDPYSMEGFLKKLLAQPPNNNL